ncbi:uncharacterized protein LOC113272144 [Papaver somniferum]|uniref:uncharacterized protein LOC113272144 n=1 Tax=Papaver somniferum TaxID=3469 RepID=UPI000E701162|nr:uncharacterized protein LOC113272144 [Papaver somniferum]
MWIHSIISYSVIAYFSTSTTSHQLWSSIEERFSRASSTHCIQLCTKLLSLTQGNKSIPSLINEIKSLSDQLAAAGELISDKELVVVTLKALNSDYIPFATAMRHRNPPVTCVELYNNLLSEETVISERHKTTFETSDAKAFVAHRGNFRGGYNNYRGNSSRGIGYNAGRYPNPHIFSRFTSGRGYSSAPEKESC